MIQKTLALYTFCLEPVQSSQQDLIGAHFSIFGIFNHVHLSTMLIHLAPMCYLKLFWHKFRVGPWGAV